MAYFTKSWRTDTCQNAKARRDTAAEIIERTAGWKVDRYEAHIEGSFSVYGFEAIYEPTETD
jgi:hypothetical protein